MGGPPKDLETRPKERLAGWMVACRKLLLLMPLMPLLPKINREKLTHCEYACNSFYNSTHSTPPQAAQNDRILLFPLVALGRYHNGMSDDTDIVV